MGGEGVRDRRRRLVVLGLSISTHSSKSEAQVTGGCRELQAVNLAPPSKAAHTQSPTHSSVKLKSREDVEELRDWLASAWDYMAMGK